MALPIEYYQKLEIAKSNLLEGIARIEVFNIDEYDEDNKCQLLFDLYKMLNNVETMLNIHKFKRKSKEEILTEPDIVEGRVIVNYQVKDYETPFSIAQKYDLSVEELLQFNNNLKVSEITTGKILKIPTINKAEKERLDSIATFGSQAEELILGKDILLPLQADAKGGDLLIAEPANTLAQCLNNLFNTKEGSYLTENQIGIFDIKNQDMPPEVVDGFTKIRLLQVLEQDKRIASINSIKTDIQGQNINYEIEITAINGDKVKVNGN